MPPATLTLSRVEQAAVVRHLELQYRRLHVDSTDAPLVAIVLDLVKVGTTVALTKLHAVILIRHLRVQRMAMARDMMALEERRIRGGFNGELDAAYRLLAADCQILDDVIARLWDILM